MEKCKIKMQNNFVVCLEKASTDASAAFIQEEVPAVGSVQKEEGLVPVVTRQVGEESTDGEPSISEDQKVAVGIDVDEDPVDEEVAVAMRVEQEVTGEPLSADKWMMSIEGTIVMGPHNNLLNGVAATFSAYYVFNLQYPKEASSTLEFVQRAFCGINSQTGSKAEKRHKLNAPVCTLLRKLLDFELMG
ncbi:Golgin subfamily B member 1 [Labeo rohita]|uniref:Golgin subfamily B member 1 n=1 Tax=Labeo rohita TaxID=84645 RepID=A0A498NFH5_LABRO|nr:Golgin subfamily B member 1 [Labeo rohita]